MHARLERMRQRHASGLLGARVALAGVAVLLPRHNSVAPAESEGRGVRRAHDGGEAVQRWGSEVAYSREVVSCQITASMQLWLRLG